MWTCLKKSKQISKTRKSMKLSYCGCYVQIPAFFSSQVNQESPHKFYCKKIWFPYHKIDIILSVSFRQRSPVIVSLLPLPEEKSSWLFDKLDGTFKCKTLLFLQSIYSVFSIDPVIFALPWFAAFPVMVIMRTLTHPTTLKFSKQSILTWKLRYFFYLKSKLVKTFTA